MVIINCRRFLHKTVNLIGYLLPAYKKGRSKVVYICQWLLTGTVGIALFTYLNIRYNWPVFHVFRNRNVMAPCVLPVYDPYDPLIERFFWNQEPLKCEKWLDLMYVDSKGFLNLNNTAVIKMGFQEVTCFYSYVQRRTDYKVEFAPEVKFIKPVYMYADFIHVYCNNKNLEKVYSSLLINIDYKSIIAKTKLKEETNEQLSVYIFGVDSLSGLLAERKLPKTLKYLRKDLHAYRFKGFTKVGDNSFPNLVPIFTGLKAYTETPGMDDIPFIWHNFSAKGAVNLFSEDWHEIATFQGFKNAPSIHYMKNFFLAIDKVKPSLKSINKAYMFLQHRNFVLNDISPLCFGNRLKHTFMIEYFRKFIEMYGSYRKFAFSWSNELTHDFVNIVEIADNDILELFQWMKETKRLEKSILIFLGDHGPRYSEIQNTEVGRISNLLPHLSIVLPEYIKRKYPHIHKNMLSNENKLTTPYDLFETLKDIFHENFERSEDTSLALKLPRGISLFKKIPSSRSCHDADISEHYCPCYTSKSLPKNDMKVESAAKFIVTKINEILYNLRDKCAKVTLSSVHHASFVYADMQRDQEAEQYFSFRSFLWSIEERTRMLVSLTTKPANARFEATVEYISSTKMKLLGDINRTNKYGNQSSCISNKVKKLYCYCI